MVSKDLGVTSAMELDGATVCVQTGTTTELNLADFFNANGIAYQPVPIQTPAEADQQFLGGACDAYTTDASQLATPARDLPDARTTSSSCPRSSRRSRSARWCARATTSGPTSCAGRFFALVAAEEYGVTSANIEEMIGLRGSARSSGCSAPKATSARCSASTPNGPSARSWPAATTARSSPPTSAKARPSNIARGLNALWTDGGLQYSPPFR